MADEEFIKGMPSLREGISDAIELRHLLSAVSEYFPLVISVNLTRNTYKMLEYKKHETKTSAISGSFDDLIKAGVDSVDAIHKKIFYDTFCRDSLLKAFAEGESTVTLDIRQLGDDGIYRWVKTTVVFLTSEDNNDVLEISLARPIEEEKARELENLRLRTILEMTLMANYEYISIVNIKTGQYEFYANDERNTHKAPRRGGYDKVLMLIRDTMVPEEDRDEYFKHLRLAHVVGKLKEGNGHYQYRYRINDMNRERWYEAAYNYSLQGGDELLMTIRDVHDEVMAEKAKQTEELFRRNRERQQILTELGFDVIIDIDLLTSKTELLGDAKSILGRDIICDNFPMGEIEAGMVHPEDVDIVTKAMDFPQSKRTFSFDFRFKRGDDSFFWCRCKAVILQDETGRAYRCICKLTDIDDQKNSEQKLIHKSQRDSLTGLYNNMTTEMLSNDFFSGEGANFRHALLVVDMDNFKQVNDNWGHKTGDKLLRSISEALADSLRSSDIVGRFGGDEFVAVLKNVNSISEIQERANVLQKNIKEIVLEEQAGSYTPLCSIGVALYPDNGNTYLEIFKAADKALYYLKRHGKNGVKFYDNSINKYEC